MSGLFVFSHVSMVPLMFCLSIQLSWSDLSISIHGICSNTSQDSCVQHFYTRFQIMRYAECFFSVNYCFHLVCEVFMPFSFFQVISKTSASVVEESQWVTCTSCVDL